MISIQHRFLFIHIPKTAGNSIQNILKDYSEDNIIRVAKHQDGINRFEVQSDRYAIDKHSTLAVYKKEIESEIFDRLFKFSTIRNPWDRMISFYFSPNRGVTAWNRDDFITLVQRVHTAQDYLKLGPSQEIETQNERANHTPLDQEIDFLMRFEHLQEDFNTVCSKLNIPSTKLPHVNTSGKKHYSAYYDRELVALIQEKFREEIAWGGYHFEGQS